jgi:hypothetical protein
LSIGLFKSEHSSDIRMEEGGECASLTTEASDSLGVRGHIRWQ